jgi:CelD/BcsL family acetyltransferase involved in cellulose biosynthesis
VRGGLQQQDRVSGFDPAFSSISPGKLVIAAALERAIEEGATTFDFLGGREPYKYEWNAIDQPRFNRYISRRARDQPPDALTIGQ